MNKLKNLIIILLLIIFTASLVPKVFQNDTFFTIAIGEEILKNGLHSEEKLVWHEGLEFTNSRWLFDIVITLIYNVFDFVGIYAFVILIAVLQALVFYFILNKISERKIFAFVFTLVTMLFTLEEFTARAQIISFLLFLLEFYCIEQLINTNKKCYMIVLCIIPILLANIHASVFPVYFVLYLPYIAEYIWSKIKLNKENDCKIVVNQNINIKKLISLIIIGILLGFCTPPGIKPYSDMFKVMNGISTDFIIELQPINLFDDYYFSILIAITIAILTFTRTKVKASDFLLILGFAIMSLSTSRTVYFFYLISSICIFRIINTFCDEYNIKFNVTKRTKIIIYFVFCIILLFFSIKTFTSKLPKEYSGLNAYPIEASNYILDNLDVNNIRLYNHFNFGSYLEFRGIKAFIDSRSGIYTPEFNDGCTILSDWYNVYIGVISYKEIFEKYNITHALLYNTEVANQYIIYDNEWKLLYQDGTFSLYEKINNEG